MQFKTLLVLLPALISAAPVAPGTAMANPSVDVPAVAEFTESRADGANIFAREATCNAPEPRSNTKEHEAWKKYMDKMREATRNAHNAEEGCDWDGWRDAMNPALKERLKKECITAYKGCITYREKAMKACKNAGGKVDQGHKNAVKRCEQRLAKLQK